MNYILHKRRKKEMSKCQGFMNQKQKKLCDESPLPNSEFCKNHQYMQNYTPEMRNNLTQCIDCKYYKYLPNGRKCQSCKDLRKHMRDKAKAEKVIIKCKKCEKYERLEGSEYCRYHHRIETFKETTEKAGFNVCSDYIRGCRSQLEKNFQFVKCDDCRKKEREQDNKRRAKILEQGKEILNIDEGFDISDENLSKKLILSLGISVNHFSLDKTIIIDNVNKNIGSKRCSGCSNIHTFDHFINNGNDNETTTCSNCRKKSKNYDEINRPDRERDWVAENAKLKIDPCYKYNQYIKGAMYRGIPFQLTFDECNKMFISACFYCNDKPTNTSLNGIDRRNSFNGYNINNCVACCMMCNYIKNCLDHITFIKRCEHILTNLKIINGTMDASLFADHYSSSYNHYINSANSRNLCFELTNEQFNEIVKKNCYICNKSVSNTHRNGIDRYDNSLGYTEANCRPCCGECNFMKTYYSYEELIEKLKKIYYHQVENNKEYMKIHTCDKTNKMMLKTHTNKERKEKAFLRKQRRKEKEKYKENNNKSPNQTN